MERSFPVLLLLSSCALASCGGDRAGADCQRDRDGDGVCDRADNCPSVANPRQVDSDANGVGDACAGSTSEDDNDAPVVVVPQVPVRAAWCPDFAIFSVSGHDPLSEGPSNAEYLSTPKYLTPFAIANGLTEAGGWSSSVYAYSDELYSSNGAIGFLDLLDDLDLVRRECIAGYLGATRVIVVAHSHGVVWAHLAVFESPLVPVDVLVDLDGTALGWESSPGEPFLWLGDDWRSLLYAYSSATGRTWHLGTPWYANDYWAVPGVTTDRGYDIEDIVPNNAAVGLEVWSDSWQIGIPFPQDQDLNYREDGSRTGLAGFQSENDHMTVPVASSDAMVWVVDYIMALYR